MSAESFTLWRDRLPPWLRREHVVLAPGEIRHGVQDAWRGALVVVEYGSVVLAGGRGSAVRFREGAVFCVGALESACVRNEQATAAVISVGRRAAPTDRAASRGPSVPDAA